jgi:hypothetical protein
MNQFSNDPNVFGIGLNKTGTTTLGECGKILGYRCISHNRKLLEDVVLRNYFENLREVVSQYNFFEDWPWPLVYKELDNLFSGSKFILTVRRNEQIWLKSLKKHSLRTPPKKHSRKLAYGYNYPHKHEKEHIELYKSHNEDVRAYFRGRENDFLEVCWENGDGWEKLCRFLKKDIPDVPFPHARKGKDQRAKKKLWPIINRMLSLTES